MKPKKINFKTGAVSLNEDTPSKPLLGSVPNPKVSDLTPGKSKHSAKYKKHEFVLDFLLFSFAAWAQFGYSFYSKENALQSLTDPLERYLSPHISPRQTDEILNSLDYAMRALSIADAALTAGTYLNMRHCRQELMSGLRKGLREYKNNEISPAIFIMNGFLIWGFFITSSFSPWTGFSRENYSKLMVDISGPTMWLGLMISYSMSYAPYTFSASKKLTDFFKLTWPQKKEIFRKIFFTRKGVLGFLPRTILSIVNRSWILYGSATLTVKWVFKTQEPSIRYSFSGLSTVSSAYQTFMSQSIKDYNVTFESTTKKFVQNNLISSTHQTESKQAASSLQIFESSDQTIHQQKSDPPIENATTASVEYKQEAAPVITKENPGICHKAGFYTVGVLLPLLTFAVFLLRTLTTPSLYTGEINDPAHDYDTKTTILAVMGLLFGGYAAYQYSQFRYSRWQDNFSGFFKPTSKEQITETEDEIEDENETQQLDAPIIRLAS